MGNLAWFDESFVSLNALCSDLAGFGHGPKSFDLSDDGLRPSI